MNAQDAVTELKSTRMWKCLNELNPKLAEQSVNFLDQIAPLLKNIKVHFPYYTRHDAHHSYEVLLRMEQILDHRCFQSQMKETLSPVELFLLICSAYGHDLGMTVFPGEEEEIKRQFGLENKANWETAPALQLFLRKNHSRRGGNYLSSNNEKLQIPLSLVGHVDKLMMAHNLSINELESMLGHHKRQAAASQEIDLLQLACILCIADSLEFSDTRVVDGVLKTLTEKIQTSSDEKSILESYHENMKHVCIGDNVAVSQKDGQIIFSGTFKNADTLHLAHQTVDLIENWIRDYCDIDYQAPVRRLKLRSDMIVRSFNFTDDFVRIGIRIKKENIINLISSNATWKNDPALVVRELLQNSVEACRYRQFNSSARDNYRPEILVSFNRQQKTIRITDNGCGMTRSVILNNFLTVGNSRSFEPGYASEGFHSLSRFGIGFWSVFTIANEAIIETGPFEYLRNQIVSEVDGLRFEVSINQFKDYTVFTSIKKSPGTSIVLRIKDEISVKDIPPRLTYYISNSDIPIVIESDHESFSLPREVVAPDIKNYFPNKMELVRQFGIQAFKYASDYEDVDLKLLLMYRLDKKATFLTDSHNQISISQLGHPRNPEHNRVGVCGFLSNFGPNSFCFGVTNIGGYKANKKDPKGISFTLNRNSIMESPESIAFSKHLFTEMHKGYITFLKSVNSYSIEEIYRLNKESHTQSGDLTTTFNANDLPLFLKNFPELIVFKLYKIDRNKSFENCEVSFYDLNNIHRQDKFVITASTSLDFLPRNVKHDQKASMIYDIVKPIDKFQGMYLISESGHFNILDAHQPDGYLERIIDVRVNGAVRQMHVSVLHLQQVDFLQKNSHFLGFTRGHDWAGSIRIKDIKNANFILNHQDLIVAKGSVLETDVLNLLNEGQNYKLCSLINQLELAIQGFPSELVKKYL
ncbi:HD domain-containing protein [Terrimonas alba]|uniref:HD domain-containing protein n=1 Tax=Terrimonas alba TaxID=3349636 RepID=UPI0035F3D84A